MFVGLCLCHGDYDGAWNTCDYMRAGPAAVVVGCVVLGICKCLPHVFRCCLSGYREQRRRANMHPDDLLALQRQQRQQRRENMSDNPVTGSVGSDGWGPHRGYDSDGSDGGYSAGSGGSGGS